ncbi:hypothetical protein SpCBS45565_g06426 [Spizellomyces sp. 'palustris']|nr:hypothetical protein SpCBS45565_g06426 [Spizellomyces sp. 'palustris']
MPLSTIAGFTEESTRQCRELVGFWRRRQEIEQEYGMALAELCQGYHRSAWEGMRPHSYIPSIHQSPGAPTSVRSQLLSMSLWTAVFDAADQLNSLAEAHIQVANQLQRTVIDPMQGHIREMEAMRKAHLDQGRALTRQLQDTYTDFRRAKQEYDSAQTAASEMVDSLSKAQLRADKKRDLEKLQIKAAGAIERVSVAAEGLRKSEEKRSTAQQVYYEQMMPALENEVRMYEEKRLSLIRKAMNDVASLDCIDIESRGAVLRSVQDLMSSIDTQKDIVIFEQNHTGRAERVDFNTVSVRSLLNPLKAGRVYIKRGDTVSGWTTNYFVIMDDGILYCFDHEDSESPREVVTLSRGQVWSLDDSYFGRANCFQLILDWSEEGAASNSGRITYNLIAESANDKHEWMQTFRKFCSCCPKCAAVYGKSHNGVESPKQDGTNVRSMRLWVMEAKDLKSSSTGLGKSINPYCVVLFNDVKQARTGIRNEESPFWGEEFRFSDIPPCRSRLRLLFFNGATMKLQKDSEIGYVSINLSTLKTGKKVEEWYQIRPFARASDNANSPVGAVRIAYILSNDQSLPIALYEEFLQIVTEPTLTCVRFLGGILTQQREEFAKTVLNILIAHNRDVEGVKCLTKDEIVATDDPNIIFRGNSVATKLLDQYMKLVGQEYLHQTLQSLIRGVYTSKESCEVDPARLPQGKETELLKRNWKRLLNHVTIFWEAIQRSANNCPIELVAVFSDMAQTAGTKFSEPKIKYAAVSGFIFLRFFCPAILSPKLFGIMNDHPDASTARTLTLIAKILQNLANLSEFEGKEPHMAPSNNWIATHVDAMKGFIEQVSTPPDGMGRPPCPKPRVDLRRESAVLHQCISEKWDDIKASIEAVTTPEDVEKKAKLTSLIPIMEKLNVAAQEQASQRGPNGESELLPVLPPVTATTLTEEADPAFEAYTRPRGLSVYGEHPLFDDEAKRRGSGGNEGLMPDPLGSGQLGSGQLAPLPPPSAPVTSTQPALRVISTHVGSAAPTLVAPSPMSMAGQFDIAHIPPAPPIPPVPDSARNQSRPSPLRKPKAIVGTPQAVDHIKDFVRGLGSGSTNSSNLVSSNAAQATMYPFSMQDGLLSNAIAAVDDDDEDAFVLAPMSPLVTPQEEKQKRRISWGRMVGSRREGSIGSDVGTPIGSARAQTEHMNAPSPMVVPTPLAAAQRSQRPTTLTTTGTIPRTTTTPPPPPTNREQPAAATPTPTLQQETPKSPSKPAKSPTKKGYGFLARTNKVGTTLRNILTGRDSSKHSHSKSGDNLTLGSHPLSPGHGSSSSSSHYGTVTSSSKETRTHRSATNLFRKKGSATSIECVSPSTGPHDPLDEESMHRETQQPSWHAAEERRRVPMPMSLPSGGFMRGL